MEHLRRLQEDPNVTAAIELGRATEIRLPGERIIPSIRNPDSSWDVKYPEWGLERFTHYDTRRGLSAQFQTGTFFPTWRTATTERHGFAAQRDRDELQVAHPRLRLRAKTIGFARWIVRQDLEHKKADLILDNASYAPGHVLTLSGGTEWDAAGGVPQDDIRDGSALITAATGVPREAQTLFLSESAKEAALNSPAWRAVTDQLTDSFPDLRRLASYLGVREVWSGNPQQLAADGVSLEGLYPDFGLLYIEAGDPRVVQVFDGTWGDNFLWAVDWTRRGGFAGLPYEKRDRSTWYWPWEQYSLPATISPAAAVRIDNISATV